MYLIPKRRVDRLSDAFEGLGEQQHNNAVREFPPCDMKRSKYLLQIDHSMVRRIRGREKKLTSASCKSRVSLESRYGMWFALPGKPHVRAFITFPRAERDLLMVLASSRTFPSAPVFSAFSEPAKSTRINLPVLNLSKDSEFSRLAHQKYKTKSKYKLFTCYLSLVLAEL